MPRQAMAERLLAAQVAIDGALASAEIRAALALFGYNEARLQAGRALYEATEALVAHQRREYGEQYGASQSAQVAWDKADETYIRTLKIARVAFKGNSLAEGALLLRGSRRETLSGWLQQATTFYSNLLAAPDLLAAMEGFGFSRAKLDGEAALVAAVRDANAAHQREKGEAQDATRQRDAKLDELDEWISDFKVIARAALMENPQLLESLGFGPV